MVASSTTSNRRGKIGVHVLVCIFGVTSWSIMNGLWVELPILVSHLPEAWTLPSYLTIISQFGNLGPLLFSLLVYLLPSTKLEIVTSGVVVSGLSLCALLYSFLWMKTAVVADTEFSVALMSLTLCQAILAATTSMCYLAFMAQLKARYMGSIFIGMGFSGLIPAFAAIGQGTYTVRCLPNTTTNLWSNGSILQSPEMSSQNPRDIMGITAGVDSNNYSINNYRSNYSNNNISSSSSNSSLNLVVKPEPAFTVQAFFLMLFGLGLLSLIAFLLLVYHPYCTSEHVHTPVGEEPRTQAGALEDEKAAEEACGLLMEPQGASNTSRDQDRVQWSVHNDVTMATGDTISDVTLFLDGKRVFDKVDDDEDFAGVNVCDSEDNDHKAAANDFQSPVSQLLQGSVEPERNVGWQAGGEDGSQSQGQDVVGKLLTAHDASVPDSINSRVETPHALPLEEHSVLTPAHCGHSETTKMPEPGDDDNDEDSKGPKLTNRETWYLLGLLVWINALQTSYVLAVQVYSSLPYGLEFYHGATKTENIVDPIASFICLFVTAKTTHAISGLTLLGTLFIAYIIAMAAMSPHPFLEHNLAGGILVIVAWVMCTMLMVYSKVSIATVMRSRGRMSLMWTGASTQLGALIGAVLAYVMINHLYVFKDEPWCR